MDKKIEELLEKGKEMKTQGQKVLKKERKTITRAIHAWKDMDHHKGDVHTGELTTAFCGINPHPCQLIKLLNGQKDWLTVPVCRQQIARVILFSMALDVDAVPPVARAGG